MKGTDQAKAIKRTRFPLQKKPWNLPTTENERPSEVQRVAKALYRESLKDRREAWG